MAIYSIVVVFWFLSIYLTFLWIKIGWNNLRANKNHMSCFIDFESLSSDYVLFTLLLPYFPVCCLRLSASLFLILSFNFPITFLSFLSSYSFALFLPLPSHRWHLQYLKFEPTSSFASVIWISFSVFWDSVRWT